MHRHVLVCHQGKDRNVAAKAKRKVGSASDQDPNPRKKRRLVQDTKKLDCPARIYVVQILRFTDHRTKFSGVEPTSHSKVMAKKRLREEYVADASRINTQTLFYIALPSISTHSGHPVNNIAAGLREALDPRLFNKVIELTAKGIHRVSDIRRHLEEYVQSSFFQASDLPTDRTRRRFYPTDGDIRNAVRRAKREVPSRVDQGNLSLLLDRWKDNGDDRFEYRPLQAGSESKFLFCCQTCWQQRLLMRYGESLTVLDAAYRTSGFPLPLFLLSVRTNMGYIVVGMFVSHSDTGEDIAEALRVFCRWNPDWNPRTFMVDYFDQEIEAVQLVFPECAPLFCYHKCKALWSQWLEESSGISDKAERERIQGLVQRIAMATSIKEQENAVKTLKALPAWRDNKMVSDWFSAFWLSCTKRWTRALQSMQVNMALFAVKGLKQQTSMLTHKYIDENKECTLSEMVTVLYTQYFPHLYREYVEFNARYSSSYLKYSSDVPAFLHSRPRFLVECIQKNMTSAIRPEQIQAKQNGHFTVQGGKSRVHHVDFGSQGSSDDFPSCACSYWFRFFVPCKHFCAVFRHVADWSWDQLSSTYRNNPLLLLDEDVLHGDDPQQTSQREQGFKDEAPGNEEADGDSTGNNDLQETTSGATRQSRGPKRALVKCRSLIRKNTDLLDKLKSQVSHLRDEKFLKAMLGKLKKLSENVRKRNQKDLADSGRHQSVGAKHRSKKNMSANGSKCNLHENTVKPDNKGSAGKLHPNDNGSTSHKCQDDRPDDYNALQAMNHVTEVTLATPEQNIEARNSRMEKASTHNGPSKTSTITRGFPVLTNHHDHPASMNYEEHSVSANQDNHPVSINPGADSVSANPDEQIPVLNYTIDSACQASKTMLVTEASTSKMMEAVIISQDQLNYLPMAVTGDVLMTPPQGTLQGTIVEHHDLEGNVTFVTADPSLVTQEVLSTVIHTVRQGHQQSFVIEPMNEEVSVIVTDGDVEKNSSSDVT